jgi:hypothetical protein
MQQEQCEESDLRAIVSTPSFWYVDDDGNPEEHAIDGDRDHHPYGEGYTCFNCGDDFIPDKEYNSAAQKEAWQTALAHCKEREAAS